MSIASRHRQSIRDAALGRVKPARRPRPVHNEYEPVRFDVTVFQKHAHESLLAGLRKDRDRECAEWGARIPRWRAAQLERVKHWPAWKRDGHESEVHYEVAHNREALIECLCSGDMNHPLSMLAQDAEEMGLIKA